jgi:hypothetical protein
LQIRSENGSEHRKFRRKIVPSDDEYLFLKENSTKKVTKLCRSHLRISALPTEQPRTGLLGLQQAIWALKADNVLGGQFK